jgi:hypothetical protein
MPRQPAERRPNPLRFHLACISVGLLLSIAVSTLEPWLVHERAICPAGVVEFELEASESDGEENHLDGAEAPQLHAVASAIRPWSSGSIQRIQGGTDLANQASAEQHRQRPPPVGS